jgi:CBS domain-containing protein
MLGQNRRWAPVVDGSRYVGLVAVTDIAKIAAADWPSLTAGDVAQTDLLPARPGDPVSGVAARLRASGGDAVAITDDDGRVVGVITRRDLSNLEILLDRLTNEAT